jgi:glutaminase
MPPPRDVRTVRRLMLTTGMYAASGEYACRVGVPAKCGVSGATIGIVPGVGGVGIYGPSLDEGSNSVGGLRLMELLSELLGVP